MIFLVKGKLKREILNILKEIFGLISGFSQSLSNSFDKFASKFFSIE